MNPHVPITQLLTFSKCQYLQDPGSSMLCNYLNIQEKLSQINVKIHYLTKVFQAYTTKNV